ncbi:hypothetical protein NLJ89_g11794 [Agrocybe chaxingu]|uniref:Uncharacterized protein n=1 Tax=Agrocybe chaxingu TaxID=84603 RepID=A0A9W8JRQ4_9AGAR|nr:hypothetical protein NLJ89_g11794 [Agrocybe chaxingu]
MKASKGTENTTQYEVLGPLSSCLCLPRGAELSARGSLDGLLKPRGIGKTKLNPVCVITTVYLTTSCAIALSETAKPGSTVTLVRSGSDPEVLRWEDPCAEIKTYVSPPSESNPEDVTLARPTECIAVGGYKLDPPGQLIQSMTDIRRGVRNSVSRGGYMTSMFERF